MKSIFRIICIAILLMLSGTAAASETATVHGIAYDWSTFEPLDNAVIEVNSTPAQSMVAKYGVYSFELPNGTYLITAGYYQDNVLTYYGEEIATVTSEGNYVLDLLLLPSYSVSGTTDASSSSDTNNAEETNSAPASNNMLAGTFLVGILLLAVLVYQFHEKSDGSGKKEKKAKASKKELPSYAPESVMKTVSSTPATTPTLPDNPPVTKVSAQEDTEDVANDAEPESKVPETPEIKKVDPPAPKEEKSPSGPVPADLQEILDILKSQGGRMTQKDMRQRLKYSEGKVSLMLLDLEKRGKIKKFKKGRGNVLFLVDEDDE